MAKRVYRRVDGIGPIRRSGSNESLLLPKAKSHPVFKESLRKKRSFLFSLPSLFSPHFLRKDSRNRLTASTLVFVMLFQTIAGIFAPVNIFNLNKSQTANAGWFGSEWAYRKEITVDHTKVSGNLSNFPMLVSFTDPALKTAANGGKIQNPSGYLDIMFTSLNGTTKLDHEIEKYTDTTGELVAWVKIPVLSSSEDTSIYIYYGNSTITASQENKTGVWNDGGANSFKMVQHMNQDPSGAAPQMKDSTQYGNNGTSGGGMTAGDVVSGKAGNALRFNPATSTHISFPQSSSLNTDCGSSFSMGAWIYQTSSNAYGDVILERGYVYDFYIVGNKLTFNRFAGAGLTSGSISTSTNIPLNKWTYVFVSYDGSAMKLYVDGVLQATASVSGTMASWSSTYISQSGVITFNGSLDEVRISNVARSAQWISTEYNNQSKPFEFYFLGIEEEFNASALSSFGYRKAITIDHTKVAGDLVDFPMLISLSVDSSLAAHAQADGDDILFVPDGVSWNTGTANDKLAHEIEGYDSATGKLTAWVKVPELSSTADTTIYMYYGNGSAASQQNKTVVWGKDAKMVQHMNENPSGAAPQMKDSSPYGHDATSGGAMTSDDLVTGKIGGAQSLDGSNDYFDAGNNSDFDITEAITASAWFYTEVVPPAYYSLVGEYYCASNGSYELYLGGSNQISWATALSPDTRIKTTGSQSFLGGWHYAVSTFSYADQKQVVYVDGVKKIEQERTTPLELSTRPLKIGGGPYSVGYLNGKIDEVRIASTARSAEWIATEYANQSDPIAFHSLGVEEISGAPALSTFAYRKTITIDHTKVAGDLANFPVLINLPTDASLAAHAQSDGDDILFTASDISWSTGSANDKLAYEIESYNPATGSLQAWVRIPNLSSTTDTVIYMYYGNATAASSQSKYDVWNDGGTHNFKMVQHMNQDPSGAAPQMKDSTQYGNDGTSAGTMTGDDSVAGKIDGAIDLDGTDDYINAGKDASLDAANQLVVEAWVKFDTRETYPREFVAYKWRNGPYQGYIAEMSPFYSGANWLIRWKLSFTDGTVGEPILWKALAANTFYHVVYVYDGNEIRYYINGLLEFSEVVGAKTIVPAPDYNLTLGSGTPGTFDGVLDEVRISDTVRSAQWISTEYNNQSNPTEFHSLGIEETYSAPALSTFGYRKAITIDHTKVSGDLTNFPVLINLPTDASLAAHTQADGDDILFTSNSVAWNTGTANDKLASEIESYNSTTGSLQAWVRIPNLSSTVDTVIYMYYGNGSVTSQQNKTAVWDSATKMVQHMNQTGAGSVGDYADSTLYANNSTNIANQPTVTAGMIGNAESFNGTSSYVDTGSGGALNLSNNFNICTWAKWSNYGADKAIISKYNAYKIDTNSSGNLRFTTLGVLDYTSSFLPVVGNWYYVCVNFDSANDAEFFINGNSYGTVLGVNPAKISGDPLRIGSYSSFFFGSIDEVRVASTVRSAQWISTEYRNQSNPTEFHSLGIEETYSAPALSFFGYRKAITIDHTKVSGDLANFPVLINLPTDSSLAAHTQADGDDILFTSSSVAWNTGSVNNKLAHEIEKYNSTTGELVAWVKVPNLSSTIDTVIYMYYGNGSVIAQQNKTAVWDSNAKMVQHMNQDPSGAAPQMIDSTQYGNDGTSGGAMNSGDLITGKIDGALEFTGIDDYVGMGNKSSVGINGAITLAGWIKLDDLVNSHAFFGKGIPLHGVGNFGYFLSYSSSGNIYWDTYSTTSRDALYFAFSDNNWHYVAGVWDGTTNNNGKKLYIDGQLVAQKTSTISSIGTTSYNFQVGMGNTPNRYFLAGSADEVRISNTARSAEWIATEYNNQSSPSTFYTLAAEQIYRLEITGSASQTAGNNQTITLTAKDAAGNTMTGLSGDFPVMFSGANASPRGTAPKCTDKNGSSVSFGSPVTLSFTNGIATTVLKLYKAEAANISVSGISATVNSLPVTVIPNLLDNFSVDAPTASNSGEDFAITITARDYEHNPVSLSGPVSLSASSGTIAPASIAASGFIGGVWSGNVAISDITEQPSVAITAARNGKTGTDSISILGTPQAPGSVSASRNSDTEFTVSWQDLSTVETNYDIERRTQTGGGWGGYVIIASASAGTTTFTDNITNNPANPPQADRAYQYRVRGQNSIGYSSYGEDASIHYTTPNTPSNVYADYLSDASFRVNYTDNAAVTDTHRLQRCSNANCSGTFETDLGVFSASPQTDSTGISSNARYRWQARAEAPGINSNYSQSNFEYTTPSAPIIGAVIVNSANSVTVNWTETAAYEDGFRVEVSTDGGAYTEITPGANTVGANISSYSFSSLGDHNYKFRLRAHVGATAHNAELFSAYSADSVIVYTPSAPPLLQAPAASSSTSIVWNWLDNSAFEENFHLHFSSGSAPDVNDIPADSTSYETAGLSPNTLYQVHMHSYRADAGESDASAVSKEIYTFSNIPSGLSSGTAEGEQITFLWNGNDNPEGTQYYAENMNLGTNSGWIEGLSWVSSGLSCGVKYSFRVKSRNKDSVETDYAGPFLASSGNCGGGAIFSNPPKAPEGGFGISINGGEEITSSPVVKLTLSAGNDTVRMALSNSQDFRDASIIPYQKELSWNLDYAVGSDGKESVRTVYAKFYNQKGAASETVSDSIKMDDNPPVISVNKLKESYLENERIIISGISEAGSKIVFNLDGKSFGVIYVEKADWSIDLGSLAAGDHNLMLIAQDSAGNSSDTMQMFFRVIKRISETLQNSPVSDAPIPPSPQPQQNLPEEISSGERPQGNSEHVPEENEKDGLPEETPLPMRGEWNLIAIKPFVKDFTQQDIALVIEKFPELKKAFQELGVTDFSNPDRLNNVSMSIPSLSQALRMNSGDLGSVSGVPSVNTPLSEISNVFKKEIPSNIVFIKTQGSNLDVNSEIAFENGISSQKASLLSGKSFQLILRPDQEAESVKGYLVLKGDKSAYADTKGADILDKISSVLVPRSICAQETETEERLVLSEFEYEDQDQDGIWTAQFQAPQVSGQYELITVLNYKDVKIGSKTLRLITVVDPEGYVYRKDIDGFETHIPNATVSLYWFNPDTRAYELWDAGRYQQKNPQITDNRGTYSFLVPPGTYYLQIRAEGYQDYAGSPFDVTAGRGVHTDIQLIPVHSWRESLTWERLLLLVFGIALFYNFYSDRKARRKSKETS